MQISLLFSKSGRQRALALVSIACAGGLARDIKRGRALRSETPLGTAGGRRLIGGSTANLRPACCALRRCIGEVGSSVGRRCRDVSFQPPRARFDFTAQRAPRHNSREACFRHAGAAAVVAARTVAPFRRRKKQSCLRLLPRTGRPTSPPPPAAATHANFNSDRRKLAASPIHRPQRQHRPRRRSTATHPWRGHSRARL